MRIKSMAVIVVALTALSGCGFVKKSGECRSLARAINAHTGSVRALSASLKPGIGGDQTVRLFITMAAEVDAGRTEVRALEIETPELMALGDQYQAMCTKTAAGFRRMADATRAVAAAQKLVDVNDSGAGAAMAAANAAADSAQIAVDAAVVPEPAIVKGINDICGGK